MDNDYTRVGAHLSVLRRRWLIVTTCVLVGTGVGLALSPLERPVYSATAQVLVPSLAGTPLASQTINDQVNVMRSDEVVGTVIDRLELDSDRSDLLAKVGVEVSEGSSVLSITVTGGGRRQTATIANAFGEIYLDTVDAEIERAAASDAAFYTERLAFVEARIQEQQAILTDQAGESRAEQAPTLAAVKRLTSTRTKLTSALALAEVPQARPQGGRILAQAIAPSPVPVPWFRGGLLGGVIGAILGLLLAYVRDRRDDAVRDESALNARLGGVLVLGRIPVDGPTRRGALTVLEGGRPAALEAFRALSTNIRFLLGGKSARSHGDRAPGNVVVVTSPGPGDGKTSVACNLAVTAASQGLRVVLVDADIRNPGVATRFSLAAGTGLADVLRDGGTATGNLLPTQVDGLRVLPAGAPTDAVQLLASDRVVEVWHELAGEADLVVVDTAPLLNVADTLQLVSTADRVVMVVRRGQTRAGRLSAALTRMALLGTTVSGVVFNAVPVKDLDGDGHYYPTAPDARAAVRATGS